jgi:hypothetical protein
MTILGDLKRLQKENFIDFSSFEPNRVKPSLVKAWGESTLLYYRSTRSVARTSSFDTQIDFIAHACAKWSVPPAVLPTVTSPAARSQRN